MKKLLMSLVVLLGSSFLFASVSEAASVSPSRQDIKGSTALASWSFSFANDGANSVRFNPGDGSGYKVVDSNNTVGLSKISYSYYSQSKAVTYLPEFMAVNKGDGTAKVAKATVYKTLP
ncbi:hypothetical protein DVB69_10845 [Sporosarcina sp. BI001-red]|uniref:hypothetical protein n=1 Tax=Sporosarcina sp. BI001-red TaxID=2282866 RepID=UPI000E246656|nr:hypothetical protein [Sporosarcina sp. BI001-red]REB07329.1 hypothetical protein DVB69_10845 [Sporosarcina sp. BI001-red]